MRAVLHDTHRANLFSNEIHATIIPRSTPLRGLMLSP